MANNKEISDVVEGGLVFRKSSPKPSNTGKIKTKARKKSYITGIHGSGAAKKKAQIRERRANRHNK